MAREGSHPPRVKRGDRAPRGGPSRSRSRNQNNATTVDGEGELNASLTERFGRGSAYRPRNQSQQQPRVLVNPRIYHYVKKSRIGEGSPRWITRPEIPTAEELLPYPVYRNEVNPPWEPDNWSFEQPSIGGGFTSQTNIEDNSTLHGSEPNPIANEEHAEQMRPQLDDWEAQAKAAQEWNPKDIGDQRGPSSSVNNDIQWYEQDGENEGNSTVPNPPNDDWEAQAKAAKDWQNKDIGDVRGEPGNVSGNDWNNDTFAANGDESGADAINDGWNNGDTVTAGPSTANIPESDDEVESFENVFNRVDGLWPSNIEYLRTHYLLLREDALRPLREAVQHVRDMYDLDEDPSRSTIGIYDQVSVCGITFAKKGLGIRVKFSLGRVGKNIRWEQSHRLMTGTLVVLMSPDKSKCKVAVIAARSLDLVTKNPPELDLFLGRGEDLDIDCTQDWIMIEERSSFFEAQRHILVALQRIVSEKFPLSKYLVELAPPTVSPKYVQDDPIRDFRAVFPLAVEQDSLRNVDMLRNWPSWEQSELDESQMSAMRNILTKPVSIIQGPPGTGKTYVSIQALKIMMSHMKSGDPPIIITCHTNHALDQLLGHVAEFESEFARVGGRSEDKDKIARRNIMELKQEHRPPPFKASKGWRAVQAEIEKLITPLIKREGGIDSKEVFSLDLLRELEVLSHAQCESITQGAKEWVSHDMSGDDNPLLKWIGKQLEPVKQHHQPTLVGFEDIDDDKVGVEEIVEQEAEQGALDPEEDFDKLGGTHWTIGDKWTGKGSDNKASRDHARELLKTRTDLWKIRTIDRGTVYRHIQRQAKAKITERLQKLFPRYKALCDDHAVARWEFEESILKKQKVIGLTTTGVSKYRGLVQALKPKIVLIEEAAETLEAPVIAACMETVEHLILVGDHQQLRPNVHVHELVKAPYHLNISLFERLVKNDVEYQVLQRQRRMKPEIRRILKPIYGTKIKDHESVSKLDVRPPVPGMGGLTTWFLTHEYHDERDQELSSYNVYEAQMIIGLVQYLKYNGFESRRMTILTFYNGQRRLIRRLVKEDESTRGDTDMHNINLKTVDSYQGEENDVVILSLVRSNMENKIGFMANDNRVCVALSRAKRGFYIFGNGQLLCGESKLWSEVITEMYNGSIGKRTKNEESPPAFEVNRGLSERRIGFSLPLFCPKHQRRFWIQSPMDWQRNVGGCDLLCNGKLECGHICQERCHPWSHEMYKCKLRCDRLMTCGHPCGLECFEPCSCAHRCGHAREAREGQSIGPQGTTNTAQGRDDGRHVQEPSQARVVDPTPLRRPRQGTGSHTLSNEANAQLLIDVENGWKQSVEARLVKTEVTTDGRTRQTWESVSISPSRSHVPREGLMD